MARKATVQGTLTYNYENKAITDADMDILTRFIARRRQLNKIKTESRAVKVVGTICAIRMHKLLPELNTITTDAVFKCLSGMPKHYSQNSVRENWNILKTFLRWGNKNKVFAVDFEQLAEYAAPETVKDSVKPSDILTDEKINRMIDHAQTIRDKAIVVVFAETGCRPKELTTLTWADVSFTGKSVQFSLIDAKKPSVRKSAFVTKRVSYLVDLKKSQSADTDKMSVFRKTLSSSTTAMSDEPVSEKSLLMLIKRIAARAGVQLPKQAACKLFRASSVTNKLRAGVPPVAIMNSHWSAGAASRMFTHYEKLSGVDIEAMLLSADGAIVDNRPAVVDRASVGFVCIKCNHSNPAGANFCQNCGSKPDASEDSRVAALERELAEMKALLMANLNNKAN